MFFVYAVKELLLRRHRAITTCISIGVAVALIISIYSVSDAYKKAVKKPFETAGVDLVVQRPREQLKKTVKTTGIILPDFALPIGEIEISKLASMPEIDKYATSIQVWAFNKGRFKVIEGLDPASPALGPVMFSKWVSSGRFFNLNEKKVVVAEKHFARFYGLKAGDKLQIANEVFKLIGTVEVKKGSQLAAPNLFLPIPEVRRLAGMEANSANSIFIRLKKATDTAKIIEQIRKKIPGVKITSPDSSLSVADSLFSLTQKFTWLLSVLVIVAAVFFILKTVSANIFERTRELGIMRVVGWTGRNIRTQLTFELLIQGIVGGLTGIIISCATAYGLSRLKVNAPLPWQGSPMPDPSGKAVSGINSIPLQIDLSPFFISVVFILALIICLLCGIVASRKAIKIKPAESLRKV